MKRKTICISSTFSASLDEIWNRLRQLETLRHIAAPFATFEPFDKKALVWEEGATMDFYLKLFGVFSLGKHSIKVIQFDKHTWTIYTQESNQTVPVWNHRIKLKRIENEVTHYTDEVEIGAGWKTFFVCGWSALFYRHRQRKWKKLLGKK